MHYARAPVSSIPTQRYPSHILSTLITHTLSTLRTHSLNNTHALSHSNPSHPNKLAFPYPHAFSHSHCYSYPASVPHFFPYLYSGAVVARPCSPCPLILTLILTINHILTISLFLFLLLLLPYLRWCCCKIL